jgi:hypothetical protein
MTLVQQVRSTMQHWVVRIPYRCFCNLVNKAKAMVQIVYLVAKKLSNIK